MSTMRVYNIEFFTPQYDYRDSVQLENFSYEIDYLDVNKRNFKVDASKVQKGDYFRAKTDDVEFCGIVTETKERKGELIVYYKPFSKFFDINLLMSFQANITVEEFIRSIIETEYLTNLDELERIEGLELSVGSQTDAVYGYDFNDGINNFFEVIVYCFEVYGIVVDFMLHPENKRLECRIARQEAAEFTIEADLENVFEREVTIKETKDMPNKLHVYNSDNYEEHLIYYKQADDGVTQNPNSRLVPVITTSAEVKAESDIEFQERALSKAVNILKRTKYENLIEVECQEDDLLIRPHTRKIGQDARVIVERTSYDTVLTGYRYQDGRITLVFGTIRIEMSKKIKKTWRKHSGN